MTTPVQLKVFPCTPPRYIDSVRMAPNVVCHPSLNEASISTPVNDFHVKWERIEEDCWILYTLHRFNAPFQFQFQANPATDMIQLDFGLRLPPYVIETDTKQYCCEKTVALWSNFSQFIADVPATPHTDSIRLLLGRSFLERNIRDAHEAFLQTAPGQVIAGSQPVYTRPLTPGEQYLLQRIFDFFAGDRGATATLAIKQMTIDLIRQFIEIALDMDGPAEGKAISVRITDIASLLQQQIFAKFPGIDSLALRAGLSTTQFKSAFKAQTGQAPFAYFRQRQMEFAVSALRSGQYNVKELSLLLHFDNPSNFTRSFRQFTGYSPSKITNAEVNAE